MKEIINYQVDVVEGLKELHDANVIDDYHYYSCISYLIFQSNSDDNYDYSLIQRKINDKFGKK